MREGLANDLPVIGSAGKKKNLTKQDRLRLWLFQQVRSKRETESNITGYTPISSGTTSELRVVPVT